MAAGKSTRVRRRRAPPAHPRARCKPESNVRPALDAILAQFNDAVALSETSCSALEAVQDQIDWSRTGSHVLALRHTVGLLQSTYTALDLAIAKTVS